MQSIFSGFRFLKAFVDVPLTLAGLHPACSSPSLLGQGAHVAVSKGLLTEKISLSKLCVLFSICLLTSCRFSNTFGVPLVRMDPERGSRCQHCFHILSASGSRLLVGLSRGAVAKKGF